MHGGARQLTAGCLAQALAGINRQNVVLQVIEFKELNPANTRYRLMMNDGVNQSAVMASTQMTSLMASGEIKKGSIVEVSELITNLVSNKRILIALSLTPIGFEEAIIGSPMVMHPQQLTTEQVQQAAHTPLPQPYNKAVSDVGSTYHPPIKPENVKGYGQNGAQYMPAGPAQAMPRGTVNFSGASGIPSGGNGGPMPPSFAGAQPYTAPQTAAVKGHAAAAPGTDGSYSSYGPGPVLSSSSGFPPGGGGYGGMGQQGQYGAAPNAGPSSWSAQAPRYGVGGGAVARNEAPLRIQPIASLNPYIARWAVKARCTSKSDIRRWNGMKGEGKLFSFDLLDKEGGEIRVTAFNDQVDKHFENVKVGQVYIVSKASLTHKKPQFNNTNHEFEVRLERDSQVEIVQEDAETADIPAVQYNFRTVSDIATIVPNTIVDVVGIVESVDQWQTLTKKNGEETQKRSLVLRDHTNKSIELTLWGPTAMTGIGEELDQRLKRGEHPVLAVKGARVGDFNGRTLSSLNSSIMTIDPEHKATAFLHNWYAQGGSSSTPASLSERGLGAGGRSDRRCTFSAIKDENLGKGEKPDWVAVLGTIAFIRRGDSPVMYPACAKDFNGRMCQKKMQEQNPHQWYCERCNGFGEPAWRYMVQLQAADHTGSQWVTAFGEAGDQIFRMPAPQLKALELADAEDGGSRVEAVQKDAQHKEMVFKLKVAEDTYNDEQRVKVSIAKVDEVDYLKESMLLLDYIKKLEAGQPIMQPLPSRSAGFVGTGSYQPYHPAGVSDGVAAPQGPSYTQLAAPPSMLQGHAGGPGPLQHVGGLAAGTLAAAALNSRAQYQSLPQYGVPPQQQYNGAVLQQQQQPSYGTLAQSQFTLQQPQPSYSGMQPPQQYAGPPQPPYGTALPQQQYAVQSGYGAQPVQQQQQQLPPGYPNQYMSSSAGHDPNRPFF